MKPPAWIAQLASEGQVAHSRLGSDGEQLLSQLRALRLVTIGSHNSRRIVAVIDKPGFAQWLQGAYPAPEEPPVPGLRAANIARAGHSKAGPSTHAAQPVLLRWFSPDPQAPWAALTRRCGIVGTTTTHIGALGLSTDWTLLTVENWEPFLGLEYAPQAGDIVAIYTGGNIPDATLRMLAALEPPPARAIHLGDYDWSGLAIYRRLRAALPEIELYVPSDITALFARFASHGLLAGQPPLAARAEDPAEVRQAIALIAQHNAGLEQEIIAPPAL